MPESDTPPQSEAQRRISTDGIPRTHVYELIVTHGIESVGVSVIKRTFLQGEGRSTAEMICLTHHSAAEWDENPLACMDDELTILIGSRFLMSGRR